MSVPTKMQMSITKLRLKVSVATNCIRMLANFSSSNQQKKVPSKVCCVEQQNSTAPEQIYPACPAFTTILKIRLLHDSFGLPYVKDRLLSCATRTLERISKNPFVEESITFKRVNPAWDRFPTPLSVLIRPVSL